MKWGMEGQTGKGERRGWSGEDEGTEEALWTSDLRVKMKGDEGGGETERKKRSE